MIDASERSCGIPGVGDRCTTLYLSPFYVKRVMMPIFAAPFLVDNLSSLLIGERIPSSRGAWAPRTLPLNNEPVSQDTILGAVLICRVVTKAVFHNVKICRLELIP